MVLCGIISRFQLLSPCMGQVLHALLTRPPLSYIFCLRRSVQYNSVRLACVRHAASVHPEPGSNSHVKNLLMSSPFRAGDILFLLNSPSPGLFVNSVVLFCPFYCPSFSFSGKELLFRNVLNIFSWNLFRVAFLFDCHVFCWYCSFAFRRRVRGTQLI